MPKGTTFLLGVYILYNLQFFLLDNLIARRTEKNSDISENNSEIESGMELSNEVEKFLEISSSTTQCLENYVGEKFESEKSVKPNSFECFKMDPFMDIFMSFTT